MLPRLEARESLTAAERSAVGHNLGFASEEERQQALADLRQKANGAPPATPTKADARDLAGMGIGVRETDGDLPTIGNLAGWLDQSEVTGG